MNIYVYMYYIYIYIYVCMYVWVSGIIDSTKFRGLYIGFLSEYFCVWASLGVFLCLGQIELISCFRYVCS